MKKNRLLVLTIILVLAGLVGIYFIIKSLNSLVENNSNKSFAMMDGRVYLINSQDGRANGKIGFKKQSCGEFPSDICLKVFYNLIIDDNSLSMEEGSVIFNKSMGSKGRIGKIMCKPKMEQLNPFAIQEIDCAPDSGTKSHLLTSSEQKIMPSDVENILATNEIQIWTKDRSNLIKSYKVNIKLDVLSLRAKEN